MDNTKKRIIMGLLVVIAFTAIYILLARSGWLDLLMDGNALQEKILELGIWGPVAIISLMTGAIVWSPIPSAPIALAAGAAYGHTWGTLYVLIGAELGALIAFALARWLGQDVISRWFGNRMKMRWFGSQNVVMAIVFVSRLLPFISFDVISYAAGLTTLAVWRFAIATMAGIIPASFLLAHFGSEMASGNAERIVTTVLSVLGIAAIPFIIKMIRPAIAARSQSRDNVS